MEEDSYCSHRGLRNEIDVQVREIQFTGKPEPHGGFYATAICPDCEDELRLKARVTDVWPADWKVVGGVPIPITDEEAK